MEWFERARSGERAIIVHIDIDHDGHREDLHEFEMLAASAGAQVCAVVRGSRQAPDPKFFAGSGKVEEICERVRAEGCDLVMFNHALSPSQERNLEKALECRVIDRTGLILDIFAQRARTHEGKLQVELAQLEHLSTRLVRGWTHLERQRGGIGLRGPGETQLETDRRLVRQRMVAIHRKLDQVRCQRTQARRARERNDIPVVSLVGYTNAGKSTLFNQLTDAGVYSADQLFATLDPTTRRIAIEDVGTVVLADTVGFIRHLPHSLVEAFRATLEESREADLLLHVVDACSDERDDNMAQVSGVLADIGAADVPVLMVYNKIDLAGMPARVDRDDSGGVSAVWLSARTGEGIALLREALRERLAGEMVDVTLSLPAGRGDIRAWLYRAKAVREEHVEEAGGWRMGIRLPRRDWDRLERHQHVSEWQVPRDLHSGHSPG